LDFRTIVRKFFYHRNYSVYVLYFSNLFHFPCRNITTHPTGSPRNLMLLFGAGAGDKKGNGIDAIALKGLVGKAIGGFWGLCPGFVQIGLVRGY
jgi:hypothetical protein